MLITPLVSHAFWHLVSFSTFRFHSTRFSMTYYGFVHYREGLKHKIRNYKQKKMKASREFGNIMKNSIQLGLRARACVCVWSDKGSRNIEWCGMSVFGYLHAYFHLHKRFSNCLLWWTSSFLYFLLTNPSRTGTSVKHNKYCTVVYAGIFYYLPQFLQC